MLAPEPVPVNVSSIAASQVPKPPSAITIASSNRATPNTAQIFQAPERRSVLVSSHLLSEMEVTADRLVIIGKGRLIGEWDKQELLNGHANLEEAYWSVASGHAEYGASETAVA